MTIKEFIDKNPSREEIAKCICDVANTNVLGITNTFAWEDLSKIGNFKEEDFWDDQDETVKRFKDPQSITHYGIVNWKLKDGIL